MPAVLHDPAPTFLPSPPPEDAPLVGIARLAAESQGAEERNDVDYRWIECRKTLNEVNGTRARFAWSINPYRGCEFGCVYCYARYTHEFMNHEDPLDFERVIYMKREAAARLRRDLARSERLRGEIIAIGAATDPYQPAEKRFGVTRSILETLLEFKGFLIEITTKSDLILRDLDLLRRLDGRHRLTVNVTVTTTDHRLARALEPRAPTPARRLATLWRLREAGIRAGVFLMPVLPGINDAEESIRAVTAGAAEAGASFIAHQVLFLTSCSKGRFTEFLAERFGDLQPAYRDYYAGSVDAPPDYKARIKAVVHRCRVEAGLDRADDLPGGGITEEERECGQLELF